MAARGFGRPQAGQFHERHEPGSQSAMWCDIPVVVLICSALDGRSLTADPLNGQAGSIRQNT
jgi:hypothetical protein